MTCQRGLRQTPVRAGRYVSLSPSARRRPRRRPLFLEQLLDVNRDAERRKAGPNPQNTTEARPCPSASAAVQNAGPSWRRGGGARLQLRLASQEPVISAGDKSAVCSAWLPAVASESKIASSLFATHDSVPAGREGSSRTRCSCRAHSSPRRKRVPPIDVHAWIESCSVWLLDKDQDRRLHD